jgi:hypothetical protein
MTVYTAYKGWSLPSSGGSPGTWGTELNNNAFAKIDKNMGGVAGITVTGGAAYLDSASTENLFVYVSGALTSNATIYLTPEPGSGLGAAAGFWIFQNDTTGGFAVNVSNGVGSAAAYIPQGRFSLVFAHITAGTRIASTDDGIVPAGSQWICGNASAPLGYFKIGWDDYALRLSGGNGGVTGGSITFTGLFNTQITNLAYHTHTANVSDPGHAHVYTGTYLSGSASNHVSSTYYNSSNPLVYTNSSTTGISVSNTNSGYGVQTSLAVRYFDVNLVQKS